MALTDDSPPFAVLYQSAADFKSALDTDIETCLSTLNSKITALMCDPDSLGSLSGPKSNAHVEFSMAKYGILAHMKSLYEEIETGWKDQLDEMKAEFIENIEVFLANTKLEVKLPTLSVSPRAVLSSLLPREQEEEESSEEEMQIEHVPVQQMKPTGKTPKRVTISLTEQYNPSPAKNDTSRRRGNVSAHVVPQSILINAEDSEEEAEPLPQTPVRRGRKSMATPASAKKVTVATPLRRQIASKKEMESGSSSNEETAAPVVEVPRRGRKSLRARPAAQEVSVSTPGRRGRTPRKTANNNSEPELVDLADLPEPEEIDITDASDERHFTLGLDVNEDLDIYSPEVNLKKTPRRKTIVAQAVERFPDLYLTPEGGRGKSKRKTIGGNLLNQSVAPSPKRLKRSGRVSLAPSAVDQGESMESNLLDSEGASELGRYSQWIPLEDIAGSVPAEPGIYELRVAQAKKPAYIGSCDSLRQTLTLHKLAQNSGHKHLDKYVERNKANILVRYEKMVDAQGARAEEKKRVQNFVNCYKTSPAYN